MTDIIEAPFTPEQVKALNTFQQAGFVHGFTCMSHEGCDRGAREDQGTLIATQLGWTCPCGIYKQYWAHGFMVNPKTLEEVQKALAERFGDNFKIPG